MILNDAGDEVAQVVSGLYGHALRFFRADLARRSGSALEHLPVDALRTKGG